jgi:DNA (cytosine-5)-methyltransferase 1
MDFLTTTEMAEKWNITRRRIATLCKEGRVEGAVLKGKTWLIPGDAKKPDDPRRLKKVQPK